MMKKTLLVAAFIVAAMSSASAQFGKWTASETQQVKDGQTGVVLTVLTDTEKNDRFIYQTDPMWTPDGKYLMFRSSTRTADGATQYFFIEVATGRRIQVTDGAVGSVFLANKSNTLFVNVRENDQWSMCVMNLDKLFADANRGRAKAFKNYLKKIGTFQAEGETPGGWCVSSDDKYAYITVTRKVSDEELKAAEAKAFKPLDNQPKKVGVSFSGIRKMDLKTGAVTKLIDVDFRVGHIQASRFRPEEVVFCYETGGDAYQRMWYLNANTCEYKPLYNETPLDWVTHETFGTEDYVYFNVLGWQDRLRKQANGIFRINLRTDDVDYIGQVEMDKDRASSLTGRGFWHCNSTRDNKWACGDTFAGSVWIINVENGHRYQIASDLKMAPDHAHPFFSPDGTKICFQSGHFSDGERLNLVMVDLTQLPFFNE